MTDAADSAWRPWFAWYPVRVYGYAEGCLWRAGRWTWLRNVQWSETQYIGQYAYRYPESGDD